VSRRLLALFLILGPSLFAAQRVRVAVAVRTPEVSSLSSTRQSVIASIPAASHVQTWGSTAVFEADVDETAIAALRSDPRVRAVTVDTGGHGDLLQSLPIIRADIVHERGFDGSGVTVAVIDSGIDLPNSNFAGRIVGEQCFCDNLNGTGCCPDHAVEQAGSGSAMDDHGHGSHVAGIIASGGTDAPGGVAPAAHIVAVKVLDAQNRFKSFTQVFEALEWILDNRPDVSAINMSLGTDALYLPADCEPSAIAIGLQPIIASLRERGVVIAVSSGNQGSIARLPLPACMDEVLGVGATYDLDGDGSTGFCADPNVVVDQVTCFTNSSTSLDLLAPGALITSVRLGGGTITFAGTSMAAPHVTGTVALMQQAAQRPLSADEIEAALKSTGTPVIDARNGLMFPRIDAFAAVWAVLPRGPVRRAVRH
jgi:subtilisin family serine protease